MRMDLTDGLKAIRVDKWSGDRQPSPWPSSSVPGPVSYAWLTGVAGRSGSSLVTTTIDAKVYVNGPGQSAPTVLTLPARDAPSTINSVGVAADGSVLSGGFNLPEGVGTYSPTTGSTGLLDGPQIEGFGRFDSSTVLGGYTGNASASAPLYLYSGSGQPQLKTYLNNGQERPVALAQVGRRVAIGSVPIKNTLGGALSLWDPATNALTVKRNLIADHSIVSLATFGNFVVGGSSNVGGTGSTPTDTDGKVFTYDTTTGSLKTFAPPRAASATYSWVAAITPDPTQPDHFWALSTGYLIQFKVSSNGSVTLTRNLGAFPNTSSPTGKELGIEFVDGTLFATVGEGLAAINPVTGEQTVIAQKTSVGAVSGLVRSGANSLFYARGARLYEYRVDSASTSTSLEAPAVTSPDVGASVAPGSISFEGTGTKNSTVQVSDGTRSRSALVRDDGTWRLAPMDFATGTYDLTFTASMDGFTTRTTEVTLSVVTPSDEPCTFEHPSRRTSPWAATTHRTRTTRSREPGTPGTVVTMVSGSRTRTATVGQDGTWSMNPVRFGWWSGSIPFTASLEGCASRTNEVTAWFVDRPSSHVAPLLISHTESDWYPAGDVVFKGKGTPGALVTMLIGNQTRFAAVSTTGRWTMRAVAVSDAPVTFSLLSELPDYADKRATVDVHFGDAPASVVAPLVTSHASGATVPAGDVVFSGKGTPRTKVSLSVDGNRSRPSSARADGGTSRRSRSLPGREPSGSMPHHPDCRARPARCRCRSGDRTETSPRRAPLPGGPREWLRLGRPAAGARRLRDGRAWKPLEAGPNCSRARLARPSRRSTGHEGAGALSNPNLASAPVQSPSASTTPRSAVRVNSFGGGMCPRPQSSTNRFIRGEVGTAPRKWARLPIQVVGVHQVLDVPDGVGEPASVEMAHVAGDTVGQHGTGLLQRGRPEACASRRPARRRRRSP